MDPNPPTPQLHGKATTTKAKPHLQRQPRSGGHPQQTHTLPPGGGQPPKQMARLSSSHKAGDRGPAAPVTSLQGWRCLQGSAGVIISKIIPRGCGTAARRLVGMRICASWLHRYSTCLGVSP